MAHPSNKSKRSLASRFDYQVLEPRKLLAAISVGDLNSGVAVSEDASGVGFILYSQQDVHARFGGIRADN